MRPEPIEVGSNVVSNVFYLVVVMIVFVHVIMCLVACSVWFDLSVLRCESVGSPDHDHGSEVLGSIRWFIVSIRLMRDPIAEAEPLLVEALLGV